MNDTFHILLECGHLLRTDHASRAKLPAVWYCTVGDHGWFRERPASEIHRARVKQGEPPPSQAA